MARMATVTVLRRHTNEFGGVMLKKPAAEIAEGEAALDSYDLPVGLAEMLARQDLVTVTSVAADPDEETGPPLVVPMQSFGQVIQPVPEKPSSKRAKPEA